MIHIVTHPLIGNFGGILQAYALQHTLSTMGYRVKVLEEIPLFAREDYFSHGMRVKRQQLKETVKLMLGRMPNVPIFLKRKMAKSFKRRFMQMGDKSDIGSGDSFVVGSDQVWRLEYTRAMGGAGHYFLDFATEEQRRRSMAYAASFGTDEWEGEPEETAACRALLNDFQAVSVREKSGVALCREVLGKEAVQMPDPTLLLPASEYSRIIRKSFTRKPSELYMADYVLDSTPEIQQLVAQIARKQGLLRRHLMPQAQAERVCDRFFMSVPQWLRSIRDSECVVTDSFHGCVFSIIFNKPFVCLGNSARGNSRFDTLLGAFDLQERMLSAPTTQAVTNLLAVPIDWKKVNDRISEERHRAMQFLRQNLPSI